jgi:gamma-glutamyltranspeptidase/glutathione hydrolase/leukotriene-C4 hydrolase
MLIHLHHNNTNVFLDFRERAPAATTKDFYVGRESDSIYGFQAVGVPGEVAGMYAAHKLYGKLPWRTLLEPSISLAKNGFPVEKLLAIRFQQSEARILNETSLRRAFTKTDANGKVSLLKEGDLLVREALAETLESIAEDGASALYDCDGENSPCAKFVRDVRSRGGVITVDDMRKYSVRFSAPYQTDVELRSGEPLSIFTGAIPSSGIVMTFMMNVWEQLQVKSDLPRDLQLHLTLEVLKHGFAHRMHLGDSMKSTSILEKMQSKSYAKEIAAKIKQEKTFDWKYYFVGEYQQINNKGTSHLSVVDKVCVNRIRLTLSKDLNVVAMTTTVNWNFGAKVISESTGIVCNNEMNDFTVNLNQTDGFGLPPSASNQVIPYKSPMSSMSPTIILDKKTGIPRLTLGASGGPTIISSVFQVALDELLWEKNKSIRQIIEKPRVHTQPGQAVQAEDGMDEKIIQKLKDRGHVIEKTSMLPDGQSLGNCQAISVMKSMGGVGMSPASDIRKLGDAAGY